MAFHLSNVLITCEHGGCSIPPEFKNWFEPHGALLKTHQGYDKGALGVAKNMATRANAYFFFSETSRLLIDLNRSLHHRHLFSFITKSLPLNVRHQIINDYYLNYRELVESSARELTRQGVLLHLSVHSFSPVFNGQSRLCDIGLLYDPEREMEKQFCREWRTQLNLKNASLRIRANYPYRGRSDGFTTHLRKLLPRDRYLGIELEINQKLCTGEQVNANVEDNILSSLLNSNTSLIHSSG